MRTLLSYLVFPGLMGTALGATWWGLVAGLTPSVLISAVITGMVVVIIILERLLPFAPEWNVSHGDVVANAGLGFISTVLIPEGLRILLAGGLLTIAATVESGGPWPVAWSLPAQLALTLVVAEACQYAWHRALHDVPILWRFHAIHHSAPRMFWLASARHHPLEGIVGYLLAEPLLIVLGCPVTVQTYYMICITGVGLLQHANIDTRLGIFNRIFCVAEHHRWHHAPTPEHTNTNYGTVLTIWDWVFGTHCLSVERPPLNCGIYSLPDFPTGVLGQLIAPFRWKGWRDDSSGS